MRHGKTRRVQHGGALRPVNDSEGNKIGEYDDDTGFCKVVYPGVGEYVGHFNENGVPDGKGTINYEIGFYEGDWKNDVKSGHGVMTYHKSGDVYNGEWADDVENGKGIMTYKNGNKYNGKWLNGERHDRHGEERHGEERH